MTKAKPRTKAPAARAKAPAKAKASVAKTAAKVKPKKQEQFWDALGLPVCMKWAATHKLAIANKPKWYAEVYLDVKDQPAGEGYWSSTDSRFHIKVQSPEWSVLFCHGGKTSYIRVRETPFPHGGDAWHLISEMPELDAVGSLLRALEQRHGLQFRREHAFVKTNVAGAKPILHAWAKSL